MERHRGSCNDRVKEVQDCEKNDWFMKLTFNGETFQGLFDRDYANIEETISKLILVTEEIEHDKQIYEE